MSNDELLNLLHKWAGETLDFHPLVEVVPGLRGGFWNQPADGAAAFSAKGAPVVALSDDYQRWPAEHLVYVVTHEIAHHRLNHVPNGVQATAARCAPEPRTQKLVDYTNTIEAQADSLAKFYVKKFENWRKERQFRQMQADIWEIRQLLQAQRVGQQLAARKPRVKTIQPKFGRGHK